MRRANLAALAVFFVAGVAAAQEVEPADPTVIVARSFGVEWAESEGPVVSYHVERHLESGTISKGTDVRVPKAMGVPCPLGERFVVVVEGEREDGEMSDPSAPSDEFNCQESADFTSDGVIAAPDFTALSMDFGRLYGWDDWVRLSQQYGSRVCNETYLAAQCPEPAGP